MRLIVHINEIRNIENILSAEEILQRKRFAEK